VPAVNRFDSNAPLCEAYWSQ